MDTRTIKCRRTLSFLFLFALSILLSTSCYIDNEETLYPDSGKACDTSNVTYSGFVAPLLEIRCNSCHDQQSASGGVITSNYNDLKAVVDNGRFRGSINHESGFSPMPQNTGKLTDCELLRIDVWINSGAPNN